MQPKNQSDNQPTRRSFIEQARRVQIVEATIDVLAEHGQGNASFARIAQHAGISPGLISYHFANKDELLREVLATVLGGRSANLEHHLAAVGSPTERLRTAIEADLIYMGTRPKLFAALVEALFALRNAQGQLEHLVDDDADDHDLQTLITIFRDGQQTGEFRTFDPIMLAQIIAGAKDRFLAQKLRRPDLDLGVFTEMLVQLALTATREQSP